MGEMKIMLESHQDVEKSNSLSIDALKKRCDYYTKEINSIKVAKEKYELECR